MHTTISLQFFYPYEPTLSAVIDPTLFDKPKIQETREGEEWTATYYVVVTSPEKEYQRHIDWVVENHGHKDWEELLMSSGRIVSERGDPNYNFDAYYDKVHSEVASQSVGPWADQASGRLDS